KTASGTGDRGKEPAKIPDYDVLWAKGWSEDFISFWSFVTRLETVKTDRRVCNVRLHKSNFALQCKQSQKGIMDRPWKNSLIRVKIRNLHLVRVFNGVVACMMFIFGKLFVSDLFLKLQNTVEANISFPNLLFFYYYIFLINAGLNYIIEYRSKDNFPFLYECQLCHCKTGLSNMFMHVCGSKHRLAYLKQHYPEIAESDEVKGKGSELNRKVRQVALTIEKKEGRKQLKVVIEAPVIRKRWQEYPDADDSPSKAKVQHVDMSLSNEERIDCKNKDGKMPDPVQEEKNVQEEQEDCQKEQAVPDEKVETNKAVESTEDVRPMYSCRKKARKSRQTFLSCEFYFFFQQSFEILNEDDAAFILKVTQTLTDALVEYRQQAASKKVMRFWFYNSIDS
ncbi:UNVERIFIED_CONTAM: hypothetical protein H355_011574, partial [Colinus virginianus]